MHKSKYMNMAGDMAMTKLMPKPDISITISMTGGGGLSSIAPRMNIGCQPYRLSYIDPKQAAIGKPVVYRQTSGGVADESYGVDSDYDWNWGAEGQYGYDFKTGTDPDDPMTSSMGPAYEYYTDKYGRDVFLLDEVFGKDRAEAIRSGAISTADAIAASQEQAEDLDIDLERSRNVFRGMLDREGGLKVNKETGIQSFDIREEFKNPEIERAVQAAINRGDLQGIGIDFANAWEDQGLDTFGKGMRSSLEAWSAGKALSRNKYDPIVLAGLTGSPTEKFDLYLQNAEKGQTLREVMNEYIKDTGASQTEKNNILSSYGFSNNENVQATEVAGAMNEARQKGAIQGAGMMLGFGPTTLLDLTTKGYTGERDESGRRDEQGFPAQVGEAVGKEVGKLIPEGLRTIVDKGTSGLKTIGQIGQLVTDPRGALGDLITKSGDRFELKTVTEKPRLSKDFIPLSKEEQKKIEEDRKRQLTTLDRRIQPTLDRKEKVIIPRRAKTKTLKAVPQKVSQLDNDPLVDTGDNITLANLARTLKRKPEDIVTETVTKEEEEVVDKSPDKFGERRLASLGGLQNIFRQSFGRPFETGIG